MSDSPLILSNAALPYITGKRFTYVPTSLSFIDKNKSLAENSRNNFKFQSCMKNRKEEIKSYEEFSPKDQETEFNKTEYRELFIKPPKLDIKILEEWINSSLRDVQNTLLSNQLLKNSSKTPLGNFSIDRESLQVSTDHI